MLGCRQQQVIVNQKYYQTAATVASRAACPVNAKQKHYSPRCAIDLHVCTKIEGQICSEITRSVATTVQCHAEGFWWVVGTSHCSGVPDFKGKCYRSYLRLGVVQYII